MNPQSSSSENPSFLHITAHGTRESSGSLDWSITVTTLSALKSWEPNSLDNYLISHHNTAYTISEINGTWNWRGLANYDLSVSEDIVTMTGDLTTPILGTIDGNTIKRPDDLHGIVDDHTITWSDGRTWKKTSSFSGTWRDGDSEDFITITVSGTKVTAKGKEGWSPATGTLHGNTIKMTKTGETEFNREGTLTGDTIDWGNNVKWTKSPLIPLSPFNGTWYFNGNVSMNISVSGEYASVSFLNNAYLDSTPYTTYETTINKGTFTLLINGISHKFTISKLKTSGYSKSSSLLAGNWADKDSGSIIKVTVSGVLVTAEGPGEWLSAKGAIDETTIILLKGQIGNRSLMKGTLTTANAITWDNTTKWEKQA